MKRLDGMLFGAFIGDALALSTHWIYDTEKISLEFHSLLPYRDPVINLFHSNKKAGDFTHYGDQSLLLLKSISSNSGFEKQVFKNHWIHYMKHYEGYLDNASKSSLDLLDTFENKGSTSDDLGGIARIAPLLYYHFDDTQLMDFIKRQTELTHNNRLLIEIGLFTTEWIKELIIGHPLIESLENILIRYPTLQVYYDKVARHFEENTVESVKDIGQSCSCLYAFPSSLLILLKHFNNFEDAMETNILCGGDSAARGMYIGMILGAALGFEKIPSALYEPLKAYSTILAFTKHKTL